MPEIITRAEAKARGLKRFFTGKPCKRGHVSERYTKSGCVMCVCEKGQRYRATYPDYHPKKHREWIKKNPEKVINYRLKWRANAAKRQATYRAINLEKVREYHRKHSAKRQAAYRALRELGIKF